jgi:hypothetical protein
VLALQRSAGNAAVTDLVTRRGARGIHRAPLPDKDNEAIVARLHEAMAGWGTDEEAIFVSLQKLNKERDSNPRPPGPHADGPTSPEFPHAWLRTRASARDRPPSCRVRSARRFFVAVAQLGGDRLERPPATRSSITRACLVAVSARSTVRVP